MIASRTMMSLCRRRRLIVPVSLVLANVRPTVARTRKSIVDTRPEIVTACAIIVSTLVAVIVLSGVVGVIETPTHDIFDFAENVGHVDDFLQLKLNRFDDFPPLGRLIERCLSHYIRSQTFSRHQASVTI
jgi:hypothetical protein